MNFRSILFLLFMLVTAAGPLSGQKSDFSCPVYKGVILIDESYKTFGGKVIPYRDIRSRKRAVFSAADGVVESIDTIQKSRIYVHVRYNEFDLQYLNLQTASCEVGQRVRKGEKIGSMGEGVDLIFGMSDSNRMLEPENYLPCRTKVLRN